jgi:hypothetical protein
VSQSFQDAGRRAIGFPGLHFDFIQLSECSLGVPGQRMVANRSYSRFLSCRDGDGARFQCTGTAGTAGDVVFRQSATAEKRRRFLFMTCCSMEKEGLDGR